MGLDLKIVIINSDESGFEELKIDKESWYDGDMVYRTGIEYSP